MKKFTLKSKIVTGVVVASVIGSSTFAFANTNAGTQFTTWGQAQINAAKTAVQTDLAGKLQTAQNSISSKAATDKAAAEGRINQAGTDEKADTKSKIEARLAEHVASLGAALQTFLDAIGGDFDTLVSTSNSNTTSTLNHQYNQLSADITTVLNAAQTRNVEDVTEQSLLVKGKATADLIIEINRVKAELTARVNSEKATATQEVTDYLTGEVSRINGQLDALIAGLETAAKNAIAAAGQSVEDSAFANFERVISQTGVQTPIVVDPQKLDWKFENPRDGKMKFEVTNGNAFDVVFEYEFLTPGKPNNTGVSETPHVAAPGKTTLYFDVNKLLGLDRSAVLVIRYLDENGNFKYATEVQLGDLVDFPNE
ncbi:hypothetical protein [Pseudoneobacillus rhizosphaerae]|uniref:Uncharacterized protein n=1 Tax=Pseudoneobacillus rhizosphaerae TaxID=2880968 RepID=A0A9C7LAT4_9BACI|nr:hypothetical protein [Pseudoneobacillus rhizosphaerae]CAG9607800.1 hypothetical protein NEOCIP111885_01492 [Pseudoneobacillus rhizosphaerae]